MSVRRREADAVVKLVAAELVGQQLQDIERRDHDWLFSFDTGIRLQTVCPWRVLTEQRIALGDSDHRQQFGLPAPIDGALRGKELLLGRTIQQIAIRENTGDLTIAFDGGTSLEILNMSSGYEGWHMFQLPFGQGFQVISMGGGQLALWGVNSQKADDKR